LKLKEPKEKLKVLTSEQVKILVNACQNTRDKFLLALLYETGMRIGEALSLHLSDIVPIAKKITIRDRGELINEAEIKTVCSPRTLDISIELANLYRSYILNIHTDEVDTNFVFIKIRGGQKG
jgi:integrase/recombinase XerD